MIQFLVDKLNKIIDGLEKGEGTVGKLLKDPSLYNRIDEAGYLITKALRRVDRILKDIESGQIRFSGSATIFSAGRKGSSLRIESTWAALVRMKT